MKEIIGYFRQYLREVNKAVLGLSMLIIGFFIWYNYDTGLDKAISRMDSFWLHFVSRYFIFLVAFLVPYSFYFFTDKGKYFQNRLFLFLTLLAPALFSLKMAINTSVLFHGDPLWNDYWNHIFYWPVRLVILLALLFIIWKSFYKDENFFGLSTTNFSWRPYLILLLIMVPLIAAASTQPDFLQVYPKLQQVSADLNGVNNPWFYKLLFELSYGSDFFSIEIFFRGFLILAFARFSGKDAIIPMACFYCTIHFGKPLAECISSYFGGIILGVVVYNTRSIYGGLIVHLGIAWLMEIGGFVGNSFNGGGGN